MDLDPLRSQIQVLQEFMEPNLMVENVPLNQSVTKIKLENEF